MYRRLLARALVGLLAVSGALLLGAPAFAVSSRAAAVPVTLRAADHPTCVLLILFCTAPAPVPPVPVPVPVPPVSVPKPPAVTVPLPVRPPSVSTAALRVDTAAAGQLLGLVNAHRAGHGLPPLASDPALVRIANSHTLAMAEQSKLYHNTDLFTSATHQLLGISFFGENVAFAGSLAATNANLLASPPHHHNIDNPTFRVAGMAVVTAPNGLVWVTEDFGAAPTGAAHPTTAVVPAPRQTAAHHLAPSTTHHTKTAPAKPAAYQPAAPKPSSPAQRGSATGIVAQAPAPLAVPLARHDAPLAVNDGTSAAAAPVRQATPVAQSSEVPTAVGALAVGFVLIGLATSVGGVRARRRNTR